MLQNIRERASGWIAYLIIGMLIIPFALWGVNSYFDNAAPLDAAKVNGTTISLREVEQSYRLQRERLQQFLGQLDPNLINDKQLKNEALETLVNQRVLLMAAQDQGLRAPDELVGQVLTEYEAFKVNGRFDPATYERLLRNQGMTPAGFEQTMRTNIVSEQLRQGISGTLALTEPELQALVGLLQQKRKVGALTLPLTPFLAQAKVEDKDIQAYYEANKAKLQNPEKLRVQYAELKVSDLVDKISVTDEQIKQAYEQQQSQFGQPEERSTTQILVALAENADQATRDAAKATADGLRKRLQDGENFAQLMASLKEKPQAGVQVDELGAISKGMLGEAAFDEALFALKEGETSAPVATRFGWHLIHLDSIKPAQVKPLEQVRDEIATQIKQHSAETQFYELAERMSTLAFENPDTLEPLAKDLNLKLQDSDWFTRNQGGVGNSPKVRDAAFSEEVLSQGRNSEALEVNKGHALVLRLREHSAASTQTLEQARESIEGQLKTEQARKALAERAKELLEKARTGLPLSTLAQESGGQYNDLGLVSQNEQKVDAMVLAEAFRVTLKGNEPSYSLIELGGDAGQALVVVSEIQPGRLEDLSEEQRKALPSSLAEQLGGVEFEAYSNSLRAAAKVELYKDRL